MDWGKASDVVEGTDAWLVRNDVVSVSWLGNLTHTTPDAAQHTAVAERLDALS